MSRPIKNKICPSLEVIMKKFWPFIFNWFVRLLALRPLLAYVPASGGSEDDCGEADGM
jgi:hypothetical protein